MKRNRRPLAVESLERRCLLAAAIMRHEDIGYFVSDTARTVERYDISAQTWLSPIVLQTTFAIGNPTTALVNADGIFVAYGQAVYRYDLNGSNEIHIVNTPTAVLAIHSDSNLLLINHSTGLYARATSVNKSTLTVIDTNETYINSINGSSISPQNNKIFGRTQGLSPSDITSLSYNDAGYFSAAQDSAYHGAYPNANQTWVFPNQSKVVDNSGTVYSTDSLTYLNSFGTAINDIVFSQDQVPIVLSGSTLTSYSNSLLLAGQTTLQYSPERIFVNNENIITFKENAAAVHGYDVGVIDLDLISPPNAQPSVNPIGLPYTPDRIETAADGSLLIFSRAHSSIFRMNLETRQYSESIPLIGSPSFMSYSAENNTVYLAYQSGLIRKIDLSGTARNEVPFATLPQQPVGLSTAGKYVFASDPSGAWNTHYTINPAGDLISAKDWNYYSTEYVWIASNRRMYFFRDGISPNDLLSESISETGAIGNTLDTPLHDGALFTHPIRVAPDGSYVVVGSGAMFNANTLQRLTSSLPVAINDAAWIGSQLFTMRNFGGVSQVHAWSNPTFAPIGIRQSNAQGIALIAVGEQLVSVTSVNGIPVFEILSPELTLLPGRPVDFGDAPSSFGSMFADNGARHFAFGPRLGANRDFDTNASPSVMSDGDDLASLDDEDGVHFGEMPVGRLAGINIDLQNATNAKVDAWIDFNQNGIWSLNEKILDNVAVSSGMQTLNFTVPADAISGSTYARVRVSSQGGLATSGIAADGEVEDYRVEINPTVAQVTSAIANDNRSSRSDLTSVQVQFATITDVAPSDFVLRNLTTGELVTGLSVSKSDSGGKTLATLTFTRGPSVVVSQRAGMYASLADGHYALQYRPPAMTHSPVSIAVDSFFRRFGDANGDGKVDQADFSAFRSAYRSVFDPALPGSKFHSGLDANKDGVIDVRDYAAFKSNFGSS